MPDESVGLTSKSKTAERRSAAGDARDRQLRVLVVDDEPLARQRLAVLLMGEPGVELVGECANGLEALQAIGALNPDLVFLDVQMPELDGLGVVEALDEPDCPDFVFVTAHSEYMERAFELHALDYLRKPYTNARFQSALAHARRRIVDTGQRLDGTDGARTRFASLLHSVVPERAHACIALQDQKTATWHMIRRDEIRLIEADGAGHVSVHFDGESLLSRRTLNEFERALAPFGFLRVHRCCIVNPVYIRRVKSLQKGEYALFLSDDTVIDSGRRYQGVVETFLRSVSVGQASGLAP